MDNEELQPTPAEGDPAPPSGEVPPLQPVAEPKLSRLRRLRARLREARAWTVEHYCRIDPRTAGLFRILLGFLCAADCIRHWWSARVFYSNDGVLSNHWHLFKPSSGYNFSVYHAFSTIGEVHVAFALALFCHLCLMVGWHARLFAVLSFMWVTSLDNRLVMVENGGYVVVNLITLYACFLPVERRFSVDAWRRSLRERRERTAADLDARYLPGWATEDYVSLAVLLVVLNLGVVYFFNVVNKSGEVWRKGETVHYVLYLNRMVTGVAVVFRKILPMWATRIITWGVMCLEGLLVPWILWPYGKRVTRTLALCGIWALHTAFGIMFRLGPFSWFLMGWSLVLVSREQWDLADAFYRKRAAPRTVIYDRTSPLAFTLSRWISRLNGMDLLHFEESDPADPAPALLAARDDTSGERFTGSAALREIAQALPGGRYVYPVAQVVVAPLFAFASSSATRRESVARFFGLTLTPSGKDPNTEVAPARRSFLRARAMFRETVLVYFAVCAVWQAVLENKSIPEKIRDHLHMPAVMSATIGYPRLYQGWGMFAPNPITDDGTVVVDGRTLDGRHIDPFTGTEPALDLTIAQGLGLGQIQQDYFNRIRLDRNIVFRQGLTEYLKAWHLRTGKPEDELVSYDVYWVRDQCPRIGEDQPYDNEKLALLTFRKPGFKPPPGQDPLPPEPKIVSAETAQPDKAKDVRTIFGYKLPQFMQ